MALVRLPTRLNVLLWSLKTCMHAHTHVHMHVHTHVRGMEGKGGFQGQGAPTAWVAWHQADPAACMQEPGRDWQVRGWMQCRYIYGAHPRRQCSCR